MDIKSAIIAGAIQLTSLDVGSGPNLPTIATTYDGTSHDVSRFYEPKNTNINIGANIRTNQAVYQVGIDTGHDTEKYDKKPSLTLGYHTNDWSITGTIGGDERHTPCYDSFQREYFCQSLTAWSDSKPKESNDEKIFISRTFRF